MSENQIWELIEIGMGVALLIMALALVFYFVTDAKK